MLDAFDVHAAITLLFAALLRLRFSIDADMPRLLTPDYAIIFATPD